MPRRPGTLLQSRPLPQRLWPTGASAAHRISYQGMGYHGGGRLVTGSVFIPAGGEPDHGFPVIGFAHGTTGLSDSAAPSRSGLPRLERDHVAKWLAAGYAVAATDYEGLATPGPHPYFNGEAVADDIVDAVRAAHQLGHSLARDWLAVGFSQGGHAALYCAHIATAYAPELAFKGTVALAPAVSLNRLVATATADGEGPLSPLLPLILAGMSVTHPGFTASIGLTATGRRLVGQAANATLRDMFIAVRGVTNDDAGITGIAADPIVEATLRAASVPVSFLDRPVLVSASRTDAVVPYLAAADFVSLLRETNTAVHHRDYDGPDHAGMLTDGHPGALSWAGEHLAAVVVPPPPGDGFDLMDRTGDGVLRRDDYEAFGLRLVQALGQAPDAPAAREVRQGYRKLWRAIRGGADTDGDTGVSKAEYAAWIAREAEGKGFADAVSPLAKAVIGLVDTDGDGVLDRDELTALLSACRLEPAEAEWAAQQLDGDGDGRVTAEEIVDAVRATCRGEDAAAGWLFGRF
ncbi:lipase family protein [Phytomonospora sp. NPDC050363]|uniref:lipase family protein n=1 Tax=Phytomonospora sp. NPDC050363 TaxID=3155642 RepID=UPI0033C78B75